MKRLPLALAVIQILIGTAGLLYLPAIPLTAQPSELSDLLNSVEEADLEDTEKRWYSAPSLSQQHLDALVSRDQFWMRMGKPWES